VKDNFEYIDELIAKVLAKEASPQEQAWIDHWANESELNKRYVEDSKKLFKQIDSIKEDKPVDTNKAWNKLNDRIDNGDTRIIELPKPKRTFQIAAAVILFICMSFFVRMLLNNKEVKPEVYTAEKQMVEKKLPDGSKVFINKNSEIAYAIKDHVREVKLKGEAYFEVVHNEQEPFVITVNDVLVKDIGTEFNVRTLENGDIEVKVDGGEVQFYSTDNEGLKLMEGEKARYNKTAKQFSKVSTDVFDNTSSYRTKVFNFKNVKLQEVIDQLNEVYGTDIRLNNTKLRDCPVTTQFNDQTIEEVLSVLADFNDLKIERNGNTYILTGGECPVL
jgi:transmembrane sensor